MEAKADLAVYQIWKFVCKSPVNINCYYYSNSKKEESQVVTGCEDGGVRIYSCPTAVAKVLSSDITPSTELETKAGPVMSISLQQVTHLHRVGPSQSEGDILVGDSTGRLSILCKGQLISRRSVLEVPLHRLVVDEDAFGEVTILTGSVLGKRVVALSADNLRWQMDLDDLANSTSTLLTCLNTIELRIQKRPVNFTLVGDSQCHLHVLHKRVHLKTLTLPAIVNDISCGYFDALHPDQQRIAVACNDCRVYLLNTNFEMIDVSPYISLEYPVKLLVATRGSPDYLICAGDFNQLFIYQNAKLRLSYQLDDWVRHLQVVDKSHGDLFAACYNGTVQLLTLKEK